MQNMQCKEKGRRRRPSFRVNKIFWRGLFFEEFVFDGDGGYDHVCDERHYGNEPIGVPGEESGDAEDDVDHGGGGDDEYEQVDDHRFAFRSYGEYEVHSGENDGQEQKQQPAHAPGVGVQHREAEVNDKDTEHRRQSGEESGQQETLFTGGGHGEEDTDAHDACQNSADEDEPGLGPGGCGKSHNEENSGKDQDVNYRPKQEVKGGTKMFFDGGDGFEIGEVGFEIS